MELKIFLMLSVDSVCRDTNDWVSARHDAAYSVSKQINDWVSGRHIVSVTQSSTDGLTYITVVVQ